MSRALRVGVLLAAAACGGSSETSGAATSVSIAESASLVSSASASAPVTPASAGPVGSAPYPGSRLRLQLPAGVVRVPYQPAYQVPANGLMVQTVDSKLPVSKKPGMVRRSAEVFMKETGGPVRELERGGISALEAIGESSASLFFYREDGTVAGVRVQQQGPLQKAEAQRILDSVTFDATATLDPFAQVDFAFADLADWRVQPYVGPMVSLGEAKLPPKDWYWAGSLTTLFQPVFPPDGEDLTWFVAGILKQDSAKGLKKTKIKIDDLDGIEWEAEGSEAGHDKAMYGVVLRAPEGSFTIGGSVDLARRADMLPTMKRIARSFKRTKRDLGPPGKVWPR